MSERGKKVLGIADYTATLRARRKTTFLDEIDRLIDWKPLERLLNKRLKRQPEPWAIRPARRCSCSRFCCFSAGTT